MILLGVAIQRKPKRKAYGPYRTFVRDGIRWERPVPADFKMEMLNPEAAQSAALKLCKGHYQTALVYGQQNIAISDLAGKASKYGDLYKKSRNNLFERIWWSGIPFSTVKPVKGPVKLVWGSDAIDAELARVVFRLIEMPIWSVNEILCWLASAPMKDLPDKYKPVVAKHVLENLKV